MNDLFCINNWRRSYWRRKVLLSNNEVCTTWITLKILPLVNIKMSLDDVKVIDEVKTPPQQLIVTWSHSCIFMHELMLDIKLCVCVCACVHVCAHLYLYLYLPQTELAMRSPFRGWASKRQKDLWPHWQRRHQSYLHIYILPLAHWGTHLWACKTHEMREVEYGLERQHQNIRPGLIAARFLTSTLGNF